MQKVKKYKLVFLGDVSVGKTSIITRFLHDDFKSSYESTVGIDFDSKTVKLQNQPIRLQLWDTAGQERFSSLVSSFIRDFNLALVVFDISNSNSFQKLSFWIDLINAYEENPKITILGNKSDLESKRQVTFEEAQTYCEQNGYQYFEISAKEGTNIITSFDKIAESLLNQENKTQNPALQTQENEDIQLQKPKSNQDKQDQCQC